MPDGRVCYARNGDVHIAYRVLGNGDLTLVFVPGFVSHVDLYDDPAYPFAPLVEQLAQHTRLVLWDKRGTGLSDPVTRVPTLDERMEDLQAVLAAVGADRPAMFGISEGGPLCILFAATFPERVRSLVLYGSAARFTTEPPDFPWGKSPEWVEATAIATDDMWGSGVAAKDMLGDAADIPGVREMVGRYERATASPAMAAMIFRAMTEIDVRNILHSVPTRSLVLARPGDGMVCIEASRAMAAAMPNAEFRELPPGPHAVLDSSLADATIEFVCGPGHSHPNERVLATVLFTDIVGSTEELSSQGDARWSHHLDVHDQTVDRTLSKYGGRRAKHTGDGIFALFDGPPRRLGAHWNWFPLSPPAGSASAPGCTPVNVSSGATNGVESPSTQAPVSGQWQRLGKS